MSKKYYCDVCEQEVPEKELHYIWVSDRLSRPVIVEYDSIPYLYSLSDKDETLIHLEVCIGCLTAYKEYITLENFKYNMVACAICSKKPAVQILSGTRPFYCHEHRVSAQKKGIY